MKTTLKTGVNQVYRMISKASDQTISEYTEVVNWAVSKGQYKQHAIDEFLRAEAADAWLIAFAKQNNVTVVTHESSSPKSQKRILIPDVCNDFQIPYCNTIQMMRELGEQF